MTGRYRRRLRDRRGGRSATGAGAVVLVAARAHVHARVDRVVFLAVAQHAVLEGEATAADVAGERPLARVSAHVAAQVLGRPEATHAERADHLRADGESWFL